ncbi:MAG: hypothetical protein ACLQU1_44180 [Bryobacteraceae bacterium]
MDSTILKTVGEIAGIGGLSLGVVFLLFREVIRKKIFPQLTRPQAYKLLVLIIVLAFAIGIAGLGAWVLTKHSSPFTSVTNIGTIQNEFLTVMGQPLHDPALEKLIQQALELTAKGDGQASIPLYQAAIQRAPLPSLFNNLAAAYAQQNNDDEARKALHAALDKIPPMLPRGAT